MKRRLFLLSGSASAAAAALTACGGGGGGGAADVATGGVDSAATGSTVGGTAAVTTPVPVGATPTTASAAPATTSTATNPGTQPATQSVAASDGMPAKILACYFTAWDTSYRITDVPTDFNVIYLFNAQNGGTNTGDGSWTWPFAGDVTSAQVQQVRQRGQKVILTIGGAGLGYAYTNRTQSTNCVNSIKSIISQIGGVDGLDFNNYEGGVLTSANQSAMSAEMVWIAQQMRSAYGANFAITSPAAPNETTGQQMMLALKNAGLLTYAAPQYYDWSGFNAVGYVKNATDTWCNLLGEEFVGVGFSANYSNGPSLSDCTREWAAIKAAHPNIRGMFCWSAQTNMGGGNSWGSTMKAALA